MGVQPILPIEVSMIIDRMVNFNAELDGRGDGDVTCKQTLTTGLFTATF